MTKNEAVYEVKGVRYVVRLAKEADAKELSALRARIDGETENLDRECGEAFMDEAVFADLIRSDTARATNLFLVAAVDARLVGFSRCEGNELKRLAHQVTFGVGVLQAYWGLGIGSRLVQRSIAWTEETGIKRMTLSVLETNVKAIALYGRHGFEIEGILRKDKLLSDGNYYNTIVMGRCEQ